MSTEPAKFKLKPNICAINKVTRFRLKNVIRLLEAEDTLFRHDSCVFLPDRVRDDSEDSEHGSKNQLAVNGLDVIRAVLVHLKAKEGSKLLIAGHTDTTGSDSYNTTLSGHRAECIRSVLIGGSEGRELWCSLFESNKKDGANTYQAEDIQHLLRWLIQLGTQWLNCDPGKIDGNIKSASKQAIKNFKVNYNFHYPGGGNLDADSHEFGKDEWGAMFDLIQRQLGILMSPDQESLVKDPEQSWMSEFRSKIQWLEENRKTAGCGEFWPIDKAAGEDDETTLVQDNFRSQTNRRVEILFFPANLPHELACASGTCAGMDCSIYHKNGPMLDYLPIVQIPEPSKVEYKIWLFDGKYKHIGNCPYLIQTDQGTYRGISPATGNKKGLAQFFSLPGLLKGKIHWGHSLPLDEIEDPMKLDEKQFKYHSEFEFCHDDSDESVQIALRNLAYMGTNTIEEAVALFQKDFYSYFKRQSQDDPSKKPYSFEKEAPWPDDATRKAILLVNSDGHDRKSYAEPGLSDSDEPITEDEIDLAFEEDSESEIDDEGLFV